MSAPVLLPNPPTLIHRLPPVVRGILASVLLGANTALHFSALLPLTVIKLLLPFLSVQRTIEQWLIYVSESWTEGNNAWQRLTQPTRWEVEGMACLQRQGWYLVTSNHQSWVDILAMQRIVNRRAPMLKFFLKHELIYVPIMGLCWWALDFPFMKRYSKEYLAKHPEKRGQDKESTRRACEKFSRTPTSVVNFLEGTRFTPKKHAQQQSPYRHLLKPKSGGIALAINVLGDQFHSLLDFTIAYPNGIPGFWEFMCGKVPAIQVHIREVPIPAELHCGDYEHDPAFRERFQTWVNQIWEEKDQRLDQMLGGQSGIALHPSAAVPVSEAP